MLNIIETISVCYLIICLDVITFPPNSIAQTVSVEVMPLMSGFLPIPTLNVFRYFPSNSRQNIGKLSVLIFFYYLFPRQFNSEFLLTICINYNQCWCFFLTLIS